MLAAARFCETLIRERLPFVVLLAGCAVVYFGFHAVRDRLPTGLLHDSLPSLLTPLAMFGVVELVPTIRFRRRRLKVVILAATTLVAAIWLEAVVPRMTQRATGDLSDAVAMAVGGALFCLYDLIFGRMPEGES